MINKDLQKQDLQIYSDACLSYLAADPNELAKFMDFAGYDGKSLKTSIGTNSFGLALMEYFAKNEPALLAMCANSSIDIDNFMKFWHNQNYYE